MAQKRNPQNEELLSAHMARRDEPNFALGNAISTYLALPALRGFWPTSAHHVSTQAWYLDDIACGYDLSAYRSPYLGFSNLYPWIYLNSNESFYYVDDAQFDIRGIDPPTAVEAQGLTLGAWVKFDALGSEEDIIAKYRSETGNRSYRLQKSATDHAEMKISFDGGNVNIDNIASVGTLSADTWHLVIGRWNTTDISVWVDSIETVVASTQVSIFNSDTELNIGAESSGGGDYFMTGYQSFIFICSSSVSDSIIKNIWHQTRYLFNK